MSIASGAPSHAKEDEDPNIRPVGVMGELDLIGAVG